MPRRYLFIAGLHKSGTSVLHRLLRAHPDVSGFHDTGASEDEGQHLQGVFPPALAFGGEGRFALDPRSHLTEDSPLVGEDSRRKILADWNRHWDLSKSVLVEKSPPNVVRSRFLQALFADSAFIFIVRNPVVTALATQRRRGPAIADLIRNWETAYATMIADLPRVNRWALLRYEDLTAAPRAIFDEALSFLGLPPATLGEEVKSDRGTARRHEDPPSLSQLEKAFGSAPALQMLLERFGYRLEPPYCDPEAGAGRLWERSGS